MFASPQDGIPVTTLKNSCCNALLCRLGKLAAAGKNPISGGMLSSG
jgi:hypothetical protein